MTSFAQSVVASPKKRYTVVTAILRFKQLIPRIARARTQTR